MLNKIRINNYKCFKDSGDIDIKPLTVLCGVNSSGKSTLMKSLLTLKQTYENAGEKQALLLNSNYVKNGTINDVLFRHEGSEFSFSVNFSIYKVKPNDNRSRDEIVAFKNITKMYPNPKKIKEVSVSLAIKFSIENNEIILSEQLYNIVVFYFDGNRINSIVKYSKDRRNRWNIFLTNFPDKKGAIVDNLTLLKAACYFENFRIVNLYVEQTEPQIKEVLYVVTNLCTLSRYTGNLFNNLKYLTPLRVYPQRTYFNEDSHFGVGVGGENTAQHLNDFGKESIKTTGFSPKNESVNGYSLNNYVNQWMNYFGIGSYDIDSNNEIIRLNIGSDNIINVGFGVSQALPIIVSGLTLHLSDTLLLEQPEIHLHPKAQMAMGDFLISMAKNGKGVIAETHSDHIINRIVRRIMDGTISQEDVSIYFVDNDGSESTISKIEIDMMKGIINAPPEFFTQFASELKEIFNIGLENLKKRGTSK